MGDADLLHGILAENIVVNALETGQVEWFLPGPPDYSRDIEKDDISTRAMKKAAEISNVKEKDDGTVIIRVSSHFTERLPWKYHKSTRHHPAETEMIEGFVYGEFEAEFEDGFLHASGVIEVE